MGLVGDDAAGSEALGLVGAGPGVEGYLVPRPGRRTSAKARFIAAGQQLLRVDTAEVSAIDSVTEASLAVAVAHACDGAGAVLISDYAKGGAWRRR